MNTGKRLLVDVSSLCWTCLLVGKDEETSQQVGIEGKTVTVNGWQHGYENAINSLVSAWEKNAIAPKDTIMVHETGNSKGLRKRWLPSYKEGRDKGRPPEAYAQFHILRDKLLKVVQDLGGSATTRPHLEGDDVLAYLVKNLQGKKVIMTGDRDLAVLIDEDTVLWRQNEIVTENPYFPGPVSWLPVYKALVGDSSDAIPGAKGFGPKAWLDLICIFGADGVQLMEQLIIHKKLALLAEDVGELKALQKIIDNADDVYASYAAGKLYPEHCENYRQPLQWSPGYIRQEADIEDERLKPYAGHTRLVHANNYVAAMEWAKPILEQSDSVALDIETSMPDQSIEWLQLVKGTDKEDSIGVDVLGSELNGLSLTFGPNDQYTLYFTCGHKPEASAPNLSSEQIRQAVACIPADTPTVIHNVAFELPILYMEWSRQQQDNGWHGFLPNCHDTKILSNYVNENIPAGLKKCSKHYFDYDQQTYGEVTQGRRMNEMTAREVLAYGADDTIMTLALYRHFKMICELEGSWDIYLKVEVKPAYLTALAFVQGTAISYERMFDLEREDLQAAQQHQKVVDEFLTGRGWDGTICPVFGVQDLQAAAGIKEVYAATLGQPLASRVRTPEKLIKLIEAQDDVEDANLLAHFMSEQNIEQINDWVASKFDGHPNLDLGSPKQVRKLLYEELGLEIQIVNNLTDNERAHKPELAQAYYKFLRLSKPDTREEPLTEQEHKLLIQKASTDDTAIQFALLCDLSDDVREFLQALCALKTIQTRCNLFYNKYRNIRHWKTNKVHTSVNQCATVTRRYSSSGPNLNQLPKKGDGMKFREIFVPHKPDAVICSIDFSGQELRGGADQSQDPNMRDCYVGEHKKDIHSMAASGAMRLKWGEDVIGRFATKYGFDMPKTDEDLYALFTKVRSSEDKADHKKADDLRKTAKNVVFGSQYDAQAPTLAKTLVIPVQEAQTFLDAKKAMFPRFEEWKAEVVEQLHKDGYVTTILGARRHLGTQLQSDNKWEVAKAERQGPNMKIQGSSAEQTKLCMSALWDSGALFKYDARFIVPIHDELVTSVSVADAAEFIKVKHQCMTLKYLQDIPEVADISLGPNFGIQHECGSVYDEAAINEALAKSVQDHPVTE